METKSVTYRITRQQLLTLSSSPIQIVPPPGPGKIILPHDAAALYVPGTDLFTRPGMSLNLFLTAAPGTFWSSLAITDAEENTLFRGPRPQFAKMPLNEYCFNQEVVGSGLSVSTGEDLGTATGSIAAISPTSASAGTGYVVGDSFSITGEIGASGATGTVTAVGTGGAVTGVSLTAGGTGYFGPAIDIATTGGTGTGLEVNINSVTPIVPARSGTAIVYLKYSILDAC
jgi:hypothetical protein